MTIPRVPWTPRLRALVLWGLLQVPLAVAFGHWYDVRVAMAAGSLAATGANPWATDGRSELLPQPFRGAPAIGYPPPAALVDGLAYRLSWALVPDPFLYNFALKVPWIAAHAALAFLVARMALERGATEAQGHRAFLAVLCNPLVIYSTAAWGQIDAGAALLGLAALAALGCRRFAAAGALAAAAVALKPVALPIALAVLVALRGAPARKTALLLGSGLVTFCCLAVLPFALFGWSPRLILGGWNYHVSVAGGLSVFSALELATGSSALAGPFAWVGWLWLPALAAAAAWLWRAPAPVDPAVSAAVLVLVFLLTRSWVSEPNLVMLVPLALLMALGGRIPWGIFHALWAVPLAFTVLNESAPQLLFLLHPGIIAELARLDGRARTARLLLRAASVVPWVAAGGWAALALLRGRGRAAAPREAAA